MLRYTATVSVLRGGRASAWFMEVGHRSVLRRRQPAPWARSTGEAAPQDVLDSARSSQNTDVGCLQMQTRPAWAW